MICKECHKSVDQPLMLYDGRLSCPYCTKELTAIGEFRVTRESEEYYRLARLCFFRWLDDPVKEKEKYIGRSVEYCTLAARAGHPKAVVFLGYLYEKGYSDESRGDIEGCRIAYGYYTAVCFSERADVTGDDGIQGYTREDVAKIKFGAARLLLSMLNSLAEGKSTETANRWFDYEKNKRLICEKYPTLGTEQNIGRVTSVEVDRVGKIYNVLRSCISHVRAPLFGVIRLTNEELRTLLAREKEIDKPTVEGLVNMGLTLKHIRCDKNGRADESKEGKVQSLTNLIIIEEYPKLLDDGGSGYLFFISGVGKHAYLGKREISHVEQELGQNNFALVKRLINKGGQSEYTFFDDDIVAALGGKKNYAKGAGLLIESVTSQQKDN